MEPDGGGALRAGALYFGIVFAAGVALGTVRTLALAPRLGDAVAVLVEVPVMLGLAWIACGAVLRRARVPPSPGPRLRMGAVAFGMLIAAEILLAGAFGQTLADWRAATFATPAGLIGFAAQVGFGLIPVLRR